MIGRIARESRMGQWHLVRATIPPNGFHPWCEDPTGGSPPRVMHDHDQRIAALIREEKFCKKCCDAQIADLQSELDLIQVLRESGRG